MRNKILHKASEMFLNLGVKSVTMDDLAEKMGISKKTIYGFFNNKSDLIIAATHFMFENMMTQINCICSNSKESPIISLFEINNFIWNQINEENAPEYQLQKYYPEIYQSLFEKKFIAVTNGITENLQRGISLGLYRSDLDIPVIARFYYSGIDSIKNPDIFPLDQYKRSKLTPSYLIYFIRAIATPKGIQELENYIKKNEI